MTWPTNKIVVPFCLAKRISASVPARSWVTVPGAASKTGDHRVWIESITTTAGGLPSDRVAIINQGRILMIDTPEAIKMKSNNGDILRISVKDLDDETLTEIIGRLPYDINEATYVDAHLNISANNLINLVPLISQEIEKLGMEIDDITIRKRTLEDAFIDMTGRGLRE